MFLEADSGSPLHSPLYTMSQCFDRIPLLYQGQIQFVDTLTRQTYPNANGQSCSDRSKNLLKFDIDQEDSWYSLTPSIVHQDKMSRYRERPNLRKDAIF